jgi:predicted DsbA family dithiol-disulfide isomerase
VDVEIWSDIACPWCYIGKRRFEAAFERFEHRDDVNVTWRSFELDPDAPRERTAGELGISAVPTFVVDRKLGASGAQPPDALLDLLRQEWAKRSSASALA